MEQRINKFLASAACTSRREAERLVRERRVTLNGRIVRELSVRVDPDKDRVKVDGVLVSPLSRHSYILYNKPAKVVCTMEDPEGRPCVGDVLRKMKGRPVPAGRLDFDAEGLLLCTNDGDLVERLIHPRYHVRRVYQVKVKGIIQRQSLEKIRQGVILDGTKTLPAHVRILRQGEHNTWVSLTMYEGRNRQVKRMFERVGHPVLKLKRTAFGPLTVQGIPPGRYRTLLPGEIDMLARYLGRIDKRKRPSYNFRRDAG